MFREHVINGANVKIHIPEKSYRKLKHEIHPTIVHRTSDDGEALMTATNVFGVIPAGGDLDLRKILGSKKIHSLLPELKIKPRETIVSATWHIADEKEVLTADDANTFGKSGTLQLTTFSPAIQIPLMSAAIASTEDLASFGASLVSVATPIQHFNASPYPLPLVSYAIDSRYSKEYLFNKKKGGGAFIEKHTAPHIWVPLSPDCGGGLILGKQIGKDSYCFSGFSIPFGFALRIQSNALHADSFLEGSYMMALSAASEREASTVIFHTPSDDMQALELIPLERKPDLSRQIKLFSSHLSFFRKMQKDLLEENRHCDSYSRDAYDREYGLVPVRI